MRRSDRFLLTGLWALALGLLLALACGGGGRRGPRPAPAPALVIAVSGGSVAVENRGCGPLDQERIRRELETAWGRGTSENPAVERIGWAGFRLIFAPGVSGGRYVGDGVALLGCGAYGAVEHEPGHHWAHVLRLPCAGTEVWHPGGFDLRCRSLP